MKFEYKALDKDGKTFEASMEAESKIDIYNKIKEQGGTILSVKEGKEGSSFKKFFKKLQTIGTVKEHDKIIFAKNLGEMIDAGLPMARSIAVIGKQVKNKKFKKIIFDLEEKVKKGSTLSDSMSDFPKVFSNLFVSMVKAGEESGNLSESLKIVSSQMEKNYTLKKKVKGAMIYPSIILTIMVIIGVLMMIFVVPSLTGTFKELGVELPLSTRIIIGISDFFSNNIILVLSAFIFIVLLTISLAKTKKGKRFFDFLFLNIPVIKTITKEVNSARTARTLSSLLSSGVDFVVAVRITGDVLQNSYYKEIMEKAEKKIEKGEPLSGVFIENEKLYPIFVGEMMAVGEETGKTGEMLLGVATFYEENVNQRTKDLSTIIEPVLMVIIAAAVGLFAISMLTPTYSLVDAI